MCACKITENQRDGKRKKGKKDKAAYNPPTTMLFQNSPFLREALSGVCSVPFFQANLCTYLRLFYLYLDATQHALFGRSSGNL